MNISFIVMVALIDAIFLFTMKGKKKMKKLLTLLFVATALTSCNNATVNPLEDGVLTIGLECAYSPFNYTEYQANDNNVLIKGTSSDYCGGYDILIAKELCKELNVKLEVVRCKWEGLIPSLQSGTIDAIIAGMTDTAERRNSIDFTNEYYSSQLVIVCKNNEKNNTLTSIEQFTNMKFIAQAGTIQADLIDSLADSESDNYAGIIAGTHTNTYPDAFLALQNNTVDCVVAEKPVANTYLANNNGYIAITLEGNDDFVVSVSIGISKKVDSSYKDKLNAALETISTEKRQELMNLVTEGK